MLEVVNFVHPDEISHQVYHYLFADNRNDPEALGNQPLLFGFANRSVLINLSHHILIELKTTTVVFGQRSHK